MRIEDVLADDEVPMCTSGKLPFRTEAQALGAMRAARYRRRKPTGRKPGAPPEAAVFHCKGCDWWHITSATTKRRTRRTA